MASSSSTARAPKGPIKSGDRGRSATFEAASKAREVTGHDADALLLAATQCAKVFEMDRHFILKRMQKDPNLAKRLRFFVEKEMGTVPQI